MAESKVKYAGSNDITITLASLAINGWRQSTAVNNTVNLYLDALVGGSTRVGAVTVAGTLDIFAYGAWDASTNYSGGLDGSDATVTWGTTPASSSVLGYLQLQRLGVIDVAATDDDNEIEWGPFSIAAAYGGVLPSRWGIVVKNATDIALNSSQGVAAIKYDGITFTSA